MTGQIFIHNLNIVRVFQLISIILEDLVHTNVVYIVTFRFPLPQIQLIFTALILCSGYNLGLSSASILSSILHNIVGDYTERGEGHVLICLFSRRPPSVHSLYTPSKKEGLCFTVTLQWTNLWAYYILLVQLYASVVIEFFP